MQRGATSAFPSHWSTYKYSGSATSRRQREVRSPRTRNHVADGYVASMCRGSRCQPTVFRNGNPARPTQGGQDVQPHLPGASQRLGPLFRLKCHKPCGIDHRKGLWPLTRHHGKPFRGLVWCHEFAIMKCQWRVSGSEYWSCNSLLVSWCECRESNPDRRLRRPLHYPLCYTRPLALVRASNGPSAASSSRRNKPFQAGGDPVPPQDSQEPVKAWSDRRSRDREAGGMDIVPRADSMFRRKRPDELFQRAIA
jgi:hypothetical protein